MTSDADYIRELNDAVGSNDPHGLTERMHPDAVWEHNPGTGSPEEGVYEGRERIMRLFERILEAWEYMRPEATEIRDVEPGVYLVRGELHCKLPDTENEIVEPYEQRLEIRDGALARGRMVVGSTAVGDSDNVAAIRRYVDAFNRLDLDAATLGLDPGIELREWPEAPGAQSYHGVDGVRRAFDTWFETWEWMKLEIENIHAAGDRVLFTLHQRAKGRASAVEVDIRSFNVYTFRDGLVTLVELFTERDSALAAAGLTADDIRQEAT